MTIAKKTLKTIALSLGGVVIVAALTIGILLSVSNGRNDSSTDTQTPQSFVQAGDEAARSAVKHEENGNTQAALDDYKKALFAYQQAGDTQGEESVKLQITYLESVLKQ